MTDPTAGDAPRTVLVSDALQARLDAFRERDGERTTTSITLAAVEHAGPGLTGLVRAARVVTPGPGAPDVRYLGAGPVQVRLRPDASGAALIDRLSTELGLPWRTWIPPVLNAYLPGRREPDNMPWLVPVGSDDPSAARLLRAAQVLDALHSRTTGGRWEPAGLLATRPEIVARHDDGTTEHVAEARARSAEWITALGPAVADPLLSWLRTTAAAAEDGTATPAALDAALRFAATVLDRLDPSAR